MCPCRLSLALSAIVGNYTCSPSCKLLVVQYGLQECISFQRLLLASSMFVCSFDNKVEHYRVIKKNNRVTVDEEEYFENLVKLVEVSNHHCLVTIRYHSDMCVSIIEKKLTDYVQGYALLLTRRENTTCALTPRHLRKVGSLEDLLGLVQ